MAAPPQDPEGETEKTFEFIRTIKRIHPGTEVMIYVYTPLPRRESGKGGGPERLTSEYLDRTGMPVWCSQTPLKDGQRLNGSIIGATRMRRGFRRNFAAASSISPRSSVAGFPPLWTSARLRGGSRLCERLPRGAIASNATTIHGS